jgi:hypothetical protein
MVFTFTSPRKDKGFILIFEREQKVFTVAEKGKSRLPFFEAETSELVAALVFQQYYSCVIFPDPLKKSDETTSIHIDIEQPRPVGSLVVARQLGYQVTYL